MWRHVATDTERDECERLRRERSVDNPFVVDDTRIPQDAKAAGDPAPPVPAPAPPVVPPPVIPAIVPAVPAVPEAPAPGTGGAEPARSRVFPHMPSQKDLRFDLPRYDATAEEGDKSTMKRTIWETGLLHPDAERQTRVWHGTHILGEGASGIVTHWVTLDEHGNIDQVSYIHSINRHSELISYEATCCQRYNRRHSESVDQPYLLA